MTVKSVSLIIGLLTACALIDVHVAAAQAAPPPVTTGFISINVGAQPQLRTIQTSQSFNLYDETATVTSNQPIANGPMFEVSAGYRVRPRFGLAAGVSSFGRSSTSTVTASIPDLIFVDRPKIVTAEVPDLSHRELGIHLQAIFFVPVNEKFDVALSAGPSLIRVKQELVSTVSVAAGTQDVTMTPETETGTAVGINVGMDASYMFRPRVGVGLFFRWAGGSVDLPSVSDLKVGGFQGGLGIRVRF